jgi:hypothetical protein
MHHATTQYWRRRRRDDRPGSRRHPVRTGERPRIGRRQWRHRGRPSVALVEGPAVQAGVVETSISPAAWGRRTTTRGGRQRKHPVRTGERPRIGRRLWRHCGRPSVALVDGPAMQAGVVKTSISPGRLGETRHVKWWTSMQTSNSRAARRAGVEG